jgi:predicted SprT family Zn-dependent metalloprotease
MEREPNQTNLHKVKKRQEPAGGEWKEIMKPSEQLHWESI